MNTQHSSPLRKQTKVIYQQNPLDESKNKIARIVTKTPTPKADPTTPKHKLLRHGKRDQSLEESLTPNINLRGSDMSFRSGKRTFSSNKIIDNILQHDERIRKSLMPESPTNHVPLGRHASYQHIRALESSRRNKPKSPKKQATMYSTQLWSAKNIQLLSKIGSQKKEIPNPIPERGKLLNDYYQQTHELLERYTNESQDLLKLTKGINLDKTIPSRRNEQQSSPSQRDADKTQRTKFILNNSNIRDESLDDYKIITLKKGTDNHRSSPEMITCRSMQTNRFSTKTPTSGFDHFGFSQVMDHHNTSRSRSPEIESDRAHSIMAAWKILDDCAEYTSGNEEFYKSLENKTDEMFSRLLPRSKKKPLRSPMANEERNERVIELLKTRVNFNKNNLRNLKHLRHQNAG